MRALICGIIARSLYIHQDIRDIENRLEIARLSSQNAGKGNYRSPGNEVPSGPGATTQGIGPRQNQVPVLYGFTHLKEKRRMALELASMDERSSWIVASREPGIISDNSVIVNREESGRCYKCKGQKILWC
jgi:hypothetical protein